MYALKNGCMGGNQLKWEMQPMKPTTFHARFWAVVFVAFMAVSLAMPAFAADQPGNKSSSVRAPVTAGAPPGGVLGGQSDSDIWRQIRRGQAFQLSGTNTGTPVLIKSTGEEWRSVRNGIVSRYVGYLLGVTLLVMVLYFLLRGRVEIEGGRSGQILPRFSELERMIHWFVAANFILLAISGLILMFGKYTLLPLFGPAFFGAVASASMQGHNLFGPLFIAGLLFMLVVFIKDNILKWVDVLWIVKGGFLFKGHASSWKYNMGEKAWFWIAMVCGTALSTSGVLMIFPMLTENPDMLRLAVIVHGSAALLVIAPAILHIYLGTVGVEGALEGMTKGEVDANWAREHHDLWAEELLSKDGSQAPEAAE